MPKLRSKRDDCTRRSCKSSYTCVNTPKQTASSSGCGLLLTEKDRAHLNWIRRNSTHLVRSALKLYREGGRGAFIIREEDAKPSGTAAHHLTVTGVQTTEIRTITSAGVIHPHAVSVAIHCAAPPARLSQ